VRSHWLTDVLEQGLREVPTETLQDMAARHVLSKDFTRVEADGRVKRISPTLLSNECRLARLKRYRGHASQPGETRRNMRQGRPSASSSIHFIRGYFGEGMVTAALKACAETYVDFVGDGTEQVTRAGQGLGTLWPAYDVLGVSPTMKFECQVQGANYLAYPDVVLLREGEMELAQLKCPSVFAINRYRNDTTDLRRRYEPQAIAEMFIGRQMGLPIVRNHILAYSFEGFVPGSAEAKGGLEVNVVVETVEWREDMEQWVLSQAEEILEDDRNADAGRWVPGYPQENANKWPCSYCSHPRVPSDTGMVGCEENEKWETPSTSSPSPAPMRTLAPPPQLRR